MSTILDKSKLPLALGARVGVIFEVIRIGEPDEQANVTLRAVEPCPGSNYRPEISMHASHCVTLGDGLVRKEEVAKSGEHEETGEGEGQGGQAGTAGDDGGGAEEKGTGEVETGAGAPAANEVPAAGTGTPDAA